MRLWYATGQVASVLGVSRHTVRNMILAGDLRAQRTPGGHHRVSRNELVHFLHRHHGGPSVLEEWETASKLPPRCWEFYARRPYDHDCENCPVERSGEVSCYLQMQYGASPACLKVKSCRECGYYQRFHNGKGNGNGNGHGRF